MASRGRKFDPPKDRSGSFTPFITSRRVRFTPRADVNAGMLPSVIGGPGGGLGLTRDPLGTPTDLSHQGNFSIMEQPIEIDGLVKILGGV